MKQFRLILFIGLIGSTFSHITSPNDLNKVIGYVGPACVVVDDLFYLHGHFMRRLAPEEVLDFKKYQSTLSLLRQLKEAVSKGATLLNNGSISLPTPIIPQFCNGFDDTPEVILDGCTVRANHVYIGDKVFRPINLIEKQRINAIVSSFLSSTRARRSVDNQNSTETTSTTKKVDESQTSTTTKANESERSTTEFPLSKDLKELLSNAFNVNKNVTERFLPVAQMSPLFTHFMKQHEYLFEPHNDDSRNFYPTQNMAYYDGSKAQKSIRQNTATEIPHLLIDDRNMNPAANQVAGGQLNPFDPLLLHLLQSLANRQQNVNEIIRQQKLIQQQLQQNQIPQGQMPQNQIPQGQMPQGQMPQNQIPQNQIPQTQQQQFGQPSTSSQSLKAGETMLIGGQQYVAVQLNSDQNGVPSIGLVPASSSANTHTVTALPPIINNNWMPNMPQTNHYGPNAGLPFNGYGIPNFNHENLRFHPGNKRMEINTPAIPLFVNGIPLPHEICRAHVIDPFVWMRT